MRFRLGTDAGTETAMTTALVALDSSKVEQFALAYAEHGNAARAYREAFDTSGMSPPTIKRKAYDVVHAPRVTARVRELQAAAAERTVISVAARMEWLRDIVAADPNELVQHVRVNCRHCHGVGFAWRWRDAGELARALDDHMRSLNTPRPLPRPADARGGFGFDPNGDPHPDCPRCNGEGIGRTIIADTTKLSGPARRLLKGIREKADGSIEVLMHDQLAAADQLNKLQAAYTNVSVSASVSVNRDSLTPRQAANLAPERLVELLWKQPAPESST
jgi:phage terminase small subunit